MTTRVLWAVCVLAALCAAQDVFSDVDNTVVNQAHVLSGDTTDDQSFNTIAVMNGHVCDVFTPMKQREQTNGHGDGMKCK